MTYFVYKVDYEAGEAEVVEMFPTWEQADVYADAQAGDGFEYAVLEEGEEFYFI